MWQFEIYLKIIIVGLNYFLEENYLLQEIFILFQLLKNGKDDFIFFFDWDGGDRKYNNCYRYGASGGQRKWDTLTEIIMINILKKKQHITFINFDKKQKNHYHHIVYSCIPRNLKD